VGGDWSAQAPAIHLPAFSDVRPAASTGAEESDLRSLAEFRSASSRLLDAESFEQAVVRKRTAAMPIRKDLVGIGSMLRIDCRPNRIAYQDYRKCGKDADTTFAEIRTNQIYSKCGTSPAHRRSRL
jgi:hypothetical protein